MNGLSFCTDEDLAVAAPSDFAALCPFDQAIARGADGSIGPESPWTLASDSTDFTASGVGPGHVVQVTGPRPPFHPPVECFGVSLALGHNLALKRRGMSAGTGVPPVVALAVSGVCFSVVTFAPQIARASEDLERRFGVSDFLVGRRTSDLWDATELRDATVFSVLSALYLDASRGTGDRLTGNPDVWGSKSRRYSDLLADLLSRVEIHWRSGTTPVATTTRLGMRIGR